MSVKLVTIMAAFLCTALPAMAQTENPAPADWITVTNQPCKVWNPAPVGNEAVTWSGECKDGLATGKGVLLWMVNGKPDAIYQGEYANGKRNGHGVLITPDGGRIEGEWVNDKLVGDRDAI